MTTPITIRNRLQPTPVNPNHQKSEILLQMAQAIGCQMAPTPTSNGRVYRGLCPFHPATTLQQANTMLIYMDDARYDCRFCQSSGNLVAFAARTWSMAAAEARLYLEDLSDFSEQRPIPRIYDGPPQDGDSPRPQNTALLTRASHYFEQQLGVHQESIWFLATLGLTVEQSQQCGIGYSPGYGLADHLREQGITEAEIQQDPLFKPNDYGTTERYLERITISDRDYTGGTIYMMAMPPDVIPKIGEDWPNARPSHSMLPGQRTYMPGTYAISYHAECLTLTDDLRLYIALNALGEPAVFTMNRYSPLQMVQHIMRRAPVRLAFAMHNLSLTDQMTAIVRNQYPKTALAVPHRSFILQTLNPWQRDLKPLREPLANPATPAPGSTPSAPRQPGLTSSCQSGPAPAATVDSTPEIPEHEHTPAAPAPDSYDDEVQYSEPAEPEDPPAAHQETSNELPPRIDYSVQ